MPVLILSCCSRRFVGIDGASINKIDNVRHVQTGLLTDRSGKFYRYVHLVVADEVNLLDVLILTLGLANTYINSVLVLELLVIICPSVAIVPAAAVLGVGANQSVQKRLSAPLMFTPLARSKFVSSSF